MFIKWSIFCSTRLLRECHPPYLLVKDPVDILADEQGARLDWGTRIDATWAHDKFFYANNQNNILVENNF